MGLIVIDTSCDIHNTIKIFNTYFTCFQTTSVYSPFSTLQPYIFYIFYWIFHEIRSANVFLQKRALSQVACFSKSFVSMPLFTTRGRWHCPSHEADVHLYMKVLSKLNTHPCLQTRTELFKSTTEDTKISTVSRHTVDLLQHGNIQWGTYPYTF